MEQLTTTNILSLFETDKAQRFSFVRDIINRVLAGDADPIKIHLQVKCMEEIIKEITADPQYRECLLDESQKYGKSFERYNGKFSVKEVGTRYDFSQCGDPKLQDLYNKKDAIDAQIKNLEKFLKNLPESGVDIVTEYGEVITVFPPAKTSTTSVSVSLS